MTSARVTIFQKVILDGGTKAFYVNDRIDPGTVPDGYVLYELDVEDAPSSVSLRLQSINHFGGSLLLSKFPKVNEVIPIDEIDYGWEEFSFSDTVKSF